MNTTDSPPQWTQNTPFADMQKFKRIVEAKGCSRAYEQHRYLFLPARRTAGVSAVPGGSYERCNLGFGKVPFGIAHVFSHLLRYRGFAIAVMDAEE